MRGLQALASTSSRRPWICSSCRLKNARNYSTPSKPLNITTPEGLKAQGPFRTRFAPSPTGYLHLGSLRTALFNYLVAKATGGQFILRIEDTDQKRTVPDAEERLFDDLTWAGIEWDEGPKVGGPYGPYKQSERLPLYTEHAEKLIASGHAYRCFCSAERLNLLAQLRNNDNQHASYDRMCSRKYSAEQAAELAAQGAPHVIRLKVPKKYPLVKDLVYGNALMRTRGRFYPEKPGEPSSFDDPILMKSDGFPTYHLANVVDDHLMNITHVIRGAEWLPSTPKHFALYQAFGWEPPQFAHVGLLLDASRAKLSKRNQDIDIASYRKQGIFPETLTNFVALLGWSHTQKKDVMSMQDLLQNASMKYTRGDSVVSFEKLWFLQKAHTERYASLPPTSYVTRSLRHLAVSPILAILYDAPPEEFNIFSSMPGEKVKTAFITKLLLVDAAKYTTPGDFVHRNRYFFRAPAKSEIQETLAPLEIRIRSSNKVPAQSIPVPTMEFLTLVSQLAQIHATSWNSTEIKDAINSISLQATIHIPLPLPSSDSPTSTTPCTSPELTEYQAPAQSGNRARGETHSESNPDPVIQKAWGKLIHDFIRWALLARYNGPESAQTMVILGHAETVKRLNVAGQLMREWSEANEQVEGSENESRDRKNDRKSDEDDLEFDGLNY
ncbi:glutamyl-tRNA synthetase [Phlyctema vagabunda]|uniref:glutamate--tRNA ligase n=1 Tax=Phlyctema vagabunda TaxID=108571 RepID=A0ABR4P331_9HELO